MSIILQGDALEVLRTLKDESVNCIITSPPYWALRDYGVSGQIGLEPTFQEYIEKLVAIFDEAKRVLRNDGTCWVNLGDTYSASGGQGNQHKQAKVFGNFHPHNDKTLPNKSLCQIPSRFAIAMSDRGWILRNEIIWHKPNCMPSSVKDRFTVDFEKVFFFVKSKKYWFETQYEEYEKEMNRWSGEKLNPKMKECPTCNGGRSINFGKSGIDCAYCGNKFYVVDSSWDNGTNQNTYRERNLRPNPQGRNKRCVWTISTKPFKEAHFATYPEALIEPMIKSGCPVGGIVLDPFFGAGTTGVAAKKLNRDYVGIELNGEYIKLAQKRIDAVPENLFKETK